VRRNLVSAGILTLVAIAALSQTPIITSVGNGVFWSYIGGGGIYYTGGNVGIGTATPASKLDVTTGVTIGATYAGTNAAPSNGAIVQGFLGAGITTPKTQLQVKVNAFATLATCDATSEGAIAPVSDSNTIVWGATVAGSSTNHILAYCDGTNWTVAAK
jgi:hypothetical protein